MTSMQGIQSLPLPRGATARGGRSSYMRELRPTWLHYVGVGRVGVLSFIAIGTAFMELDQGAMALLCLYLVGFASSVWYLHVLERTKDISAAQSWAQVLIDLSMVAVTVAYTNGLTSFFAFMFVVVVLEAGLLLGLSQGFVLSTLASAFMMQQMYVTVVRTEGGAQYELWYSLLIQTLAFYLTAFISGYWNQRLNRLQEFQREILDNMNSGFLITDSDGVIAVQNKSAKHILHMQAESGVGTLVSEILRVESGGECPVITALRLGQDFTSYEFRALTDDGGTLLLGLTTNCMFDSDGGITGIIVSFTDLTEISAMREELRRQDRLAVVGELAAGLAHEIRNPLAVIRGSLDEMVHGLDDRQLEEKLWGMALRESDHLNEIVGGFLDFAREPTVKREHFDVGDLTSEVVDLLRREHADQEALQINTALPDESRFVSGDRSKIKQVLVNLGKNAIEAMDGVGKLDVVVTHDEGPIEIRFDDEGTGIEPDKFTRIFEPFFTTKQSGVGMGLAVCLRIITAHDGTIRASAREGGGCSMRVLLPSAVHEKELVS